MGCDESLVLRNAKLQFGSPDYIVDSSIMLSNFPFGKEAKVNVVIDVTEPKIEAS
jgi:hypothetical protein